MSKAPSIDPGVEMAVRLRMVCEVHDIRIASHLDRVSRYACELGRLAGLPTSKLIELHYAAPLHDIGKIGLPLELLNKPGDLTAKERELIQAHTVIGHRILDGNPWPVIVCAAEVALSHHECWDGTGYPHRLSGTKIPLSARIVAVADVFDALVSSRAYKPAWEETHAIAEMVKLRGTKFDPEILDLFLQHLPGMALPAARV